MVENCLCILKEKVSKHWSTLFLCSALWRLMLFFFEPNSLSIVGLSCRHVPGGHGCILSFRNSCEPGASASSG